MSLGLVSGKYGKRQEYEKDIYVNLILVPTGNLILSENSCNNSKVNI